MPQQSNVPKKSDLNGKKMKKVYIIIVVCLMSRLSAPGFVAAQVHQYTLKQAVTTGLSANPGVDSARQVLAQSQLKIKAARGHFLPSVSLQSGFSRYSQRGDIMSVDELDRDIFSNQVKVSETLFNGFATLSNYAKSKLQAQMDKAKLAQSRLDLIYDIQRAFLSLLKANENLESVNDEITRIQSQLEESKVFFKSGFKPHTDVLKNEAALAKAHSDKIKVQNQIKNYTILLNTYLALPYDEKIAYEGNLQSYNLNVDYDIDSAVKTAKSKRPDLIVEKKALAVAEQEVRETKSQYYPRVTLDYSWIKQHNDYTNYTRSTSKQDINTIGVNLNWNLFDGGSTTYTHLGDLRHINALEKELKDKTAHATADILQAFTDIDDAQKLIELARETRKSALENYDMANARYKIRIGSLDDLLSAQHDLTQSESDISDAYAQYQIARAALFYNMGIENSGLKATVSK